MSEQVSFGYESVDPEEKTRRVGAVFSSVAARYDLMNDAMSGGCTGCGRTSSSAG